MDVNISSGEKQDGVETTVASLPAPPGGELSNKPRTGNRKRRRGKHKRKVMKTFARPRVWNAEKRRAGEERRRRVRPKPPNETGAPYNNNQFLMEIHAPHQEPRTRDSSFSVDSEENYLYSLPEDEEEFLTKEFSSVYEDAACERLAGLNKAELLQEYLALEARYENMSRSGEAELRRRLREREQQVRELEAENEKLRQQVERLQHASSSSADSESDSVSSLSSASSPNPHHQPVFNGHADIDFAETNGDVSPLPAPTVNGFNDDDDV